MFKLKTSLFFLIKQVAVICAWCQRNRLFTFTNYFPLSWCCFSLRCYAECIPGALLTWLSFLQAHSSFGKLKASDTGGSCPCLEHGSQQKRRSLSESNRWTFLRNRFVQGFRKQSFPGKVGKVLLTACNCSSFRILEESQFTLWCKTWPLRGFG